MNLGAHGVPPLAAGGEQTHQRRSPSPAAPNSRCTALPSGSRRSPARRRASQVMRQRRPGISTSAWISPTDISVLARPRRKKICSRDRWRQSLEGLDVLFGRLESPQRKWCHRFHISIYIEVRGLVKGRGQGFHPTEIPSVPPGRAARLVGMRDRLLHLLFFLSGASGLIYQVVWVREFGNVFGNTIHSAALVIAVFMAGPGIGSYLGGRWAGSSPCGSPRLPRRRVRKRRAGHRCARPARRPSFCPGWGRRRRHFPPIRAMATRWYVLFHPPIWPGMPSRPPLLCRSRC